MMLRPGFIVGLLVLVAIIKIANSERCLPVFKEKILKRVLYHSDKPFNITLSVSNKTTHRLVSEITKIFLMEVLGYTNVNFYIRGDDFEVEKAAGPLKIRQENYVPPAIIDMEMWVQATSEMVFPFYQLTEVGLVTPTGSLSWFSPAFLPKQHQEFTWYMFTKLETASRFAINETYLPSMNIFGDRGGQRNDTPNQLYIPERCNNSEQGVALECALLLTDSYANYSYVIDSYINELELYVKVAFIGEGLEKLVENLIREYKREYSRNSTIATDNRSLVIMYYTPSSIFPNPYDKDLILYEIPCRKPERRAGCELEKYNLKKIVWENIQSIDEFLYDALTKINFSYHVYEDLLIKRSQWPLDNKTFDEIIACDWLNDNLNYIRQEWVPNTMATLTIGAIVPINGDIYNRGNSISIAAKMAMHAINNAKILGKYKLDVSFEDGQCKSDTVVKSFIQLLTGHHYKRILGVLGPACSETVEPLIGVTNSYKIPVISYAAEGSSFDNRKKYPYFFRTIGENKQYRYVYAQLLEKLGWHRVASLTEDGQKYTEYISYMQDTLRDKNITFVENVKFPREQEATMMSKLLNDLKKKRAKIIIADVYDKVARQVMCEAYNLNMTAAKGYVWFLPLWLKQNWYDTDFYNQEGENVSCNTTVMNKAIDGYLGLSHAELAQDDYITHENMTAREWYNNYKKEAEPELHYDSSLISNYIGYAYDAMWTYALALSKLIDEDESYLLHLHESTETVKRFTQLIADIDFRGVTGRIKFYGGSSRYSVVNIEQFINNSRTIVGQFHPILTDTKADVIDGTLELNISRFQWLSGSKPDDGSDDGSELPAKCVLSGLADILDISCEVAIVILNIIIFGFLGVILIVGFIIIKQKYDEKVRLHEKYMKSLGIDLSHTETSSLDIWEIPRDRVVINRKIGEGAFGTVYGGETFFPEKGWLAVAVKTLKVGSSIDEKLDFLSEVEVMKRFEHKNIIKLLGVCVKCEPVLTVMEFMLYGDLKTYLLARRHLVNDQSYEDSDEISNKRLTAMALDVSRALSYLAQLKYVHRDIASRNCLVNAQRMVKLGDFGMTRPMYENDYYRFNRKGMLPVRWMSPESLGLGIFTPASDVWSYGVLLYEIITFGSFPFQGMSNNEVLSHVKAGNSLIVPKKIKTQLENLMYSCWNVDNAKRPTAPEIVDFLATNPRIVSPCLDVPLASVQMEHTGQMDINLSNNMRKFSLPWPSQRSLSQTHVGDSKSIDSPISLLLDLNSQDDDQNSDPLLIGRSGEQESISPLLDSTKTLLLKQTWPKDNSNARDSQSYKYVNLQPDMIKLNCEPGRNGSSGNIQMGERTSMLPEEKGSDNMSVL